VTSSQANKQQATSLQAGKPFPSDEQSKATPMGSGLHIAQATNSIERRAKTHFKTSAKSRYHPA